MALKSIPKGQSFSISFVLPETYDTDNINAYYVKIGSKRYTVTLASGVFTCRLTSAQTQALTGNQSVILTIVDDLYGVLKLQIGDIHFENTAEQFSNDDENQIYDVIVNLIITEQSAVEVDSVILDAIKGDKGDTGAQGEKGDKGDPGDVPEFTRTITRADATFEQGFLKLSHTTATNNLKLELFSFKMITGLGDEYPELVVKYPPRINNNTAPYNGWYLSTKEYPNLELKDWDSITIAYDVESDTVSKYDCLFDVDGDNVVLEEAAGQTYHSTIGAATFDAVYPDFAGSLIQTVTDSLVLGQVTSSYQPVYMQKKKADIYSYPYAAGALSESAAGNPNILPVASHYDNTFTRHDITSSATDFLPNAIAVGARVNDATTQSGTSYGFGMEFFEPANNLTMNADYPDVTFPFAISYGVLEDIPDRIKIVSQKPGFSFLNTLQIEEGGSISIGTSSEITGTAVIQEILSATEVTVEAGTLSWTSGTMYIYLPAAKIGTMWQPKADDQNYYQSPVCTIVMAKLKKIKDATKANWQTIRLAARATASNNGIWDMYRGFGIINVDAAIAYIENSLNIEQAAQQLSEKSGVPDYLAYADIKANTPLPKRLTSPIGHDHSGEDIEPESVTTDQIVLNGFDRLGNPITVNLVYNTDLGVVEFQYPDGTIGQDHLELWFVAKCQGACRNGYGAQFVSSQGGHIVVKELVASELNTQPQLFMGIFTQTAANGEFIKITWFGSVNDVSTTAYEAEGSAKILYVDMEGSGLRGFTTIVPNAPYRKIMAASIQKYSTGASENGVILVRPTFGTKLSDLDDVDGTDTTIADTDTVLKNDASVWKKITWANVKTLLSSVFESLSNKKTTLSDNSDTFYPSQKAVKTAVDAKANLSGGNTFSGTQNISNVLQQVVGQYFYQCASLTADTLNDVRYYVSAGVMIHERCTVANAAKGGGTWTESMRFDMVDRIIKAKHIIYASDGAAILAATQVSQSSNSAGTWGNTSTAANSAMALLSKNTEFLRGLPDQSINIVATKYLYNAASPTADTVNDTRSYTTAAGEKIFEVCTVANATKGSGTWVAGTLGVAKIKPLVDGTTAVQFTKADGSTAVITVDTTNSNVSIGAAISAYKLFVAGTISVSGTSYMSSVGFTVSNNGLSTYGNEFTGASSSVRLISKNTEFLRGLPDQSINIVATKYLYNAASPTADTINDTRSYNSAGVTIYQICTVANATKGSGTWVTIASQQMSALTDSNELIWAGSFIDLETSRSGKGSIIFGDGVGYADFIFTTAGVVTLIQYTSNVFTSVQTGTNHVIIKDNGSNVRIVNEMGSTLNFNVKIQYN